MSVGEFFDFPAAAAWNPVFKRSQRDWLTATVKPVQPLSMMLARAYRDTAKRIDYVAANNELRETVKTLERHGLNLSWSDEDLCAWCDKRAEKAAPLLREAERTDSPDKIAEIINTARATVERFGLEFPEPGEFGPLPCLRRLADAKWWRLKVRRLQAREVEKVAILLRRVRKGREIYCSDETVRRRSVQKFRNRKYLEGTEAVNQDGQRYTLAELADLSISNPRIRRVELMVRVRGFDEVAQQCGHEREFWTLTTPSRFHRWTTAGKGSIVRENPRWDGSTPSDAQEWLCKVWARIRSALDREGVRLYGFRVVEAHHDGTPHWHAAIFFHPHWQENEAIASSPKVRAIVERCALKEERVAEKKAKIACIRAERKALVMTERAIKARQKADAMTERAVKTRARADALDAMAQELREIARQARKAAGKASALHREAEKHRCDFKKIDPEKGDAASYLAKYITKAIAADDAGDMVQQDLYGYDGGDSARRVDAWASCNGIRQFQQIGGPSVTAWRELRKAMGGEVSQADLFDAPRKVQLAAEAADESDWLSFVLLMGGPMVKRDDQLLRLGYWHEHTEDGEVVGNAMTAYGEPAVERIYGLRYQAKSSNWAQLVRKSHHRKEVPILTRVNTWTVRQPAVAKPPVETRPEIRAEVRESIATTSEGREFKPWAFAALGLDFRFSGGAAAPPLDSGQ